MEDTVPEASSLTRATSDTDRILIDFVSRIPELQMNGCLVLDGPEDYIQEASHILHKRGYATRIFLGKLVNTNPDPHDNQIGNSMTLEYYPPRWERMNQLAVGFTPEDLEDLKPVQAPPRGDFW